jgi:cell division protein FtsL
MPDRRPARFSGLARARRLRPSPTVALWGAGIILVMLFMWEQGSVDRLVMELERAENQRRDLQSEVDALVMEADQLSSLAQVERRAQRELGLIRPDTDQIVRLRFEKSPGEPSRFRLDPLVPEAVAGTPDREADR